jgi:hypothetical protein
MEIILLDSHPWVRYNRFTQGPVAQLGARLNRTEEVRGSNPLRSTVLGSDWLTNDLITVKIADELQPGQFSSLGPIAQLGARLNGIEKVEGSNPSGSTALPICESQSGVVGHPASEMGERGESPSQCQQSTLIKTELACHPQGRLCW